MSVHLSIKCNLMFIAVGVRFDTPSFRLENDSTLGQQRFFFWANQFDPQIHNCPAIRHRPFQTFMMYMLSSSLPNSPVYHPDHTSYQAVKVAGTKENIASLVGKLAFVQAQSFLKNPISDLCPTLIVCAIRSTRSSKGIGCPEVTLQCCVIRI